MTVLRGRRAAASARPVPADPPDWVAALTAAGPDRDQALRRLHGLMLAAARHQVNRMSGLLPLASRNVLDELAHDSADDAVTALLGKLGTFEGRSRFTTWAYKFAIFQAATEVRRRAWASREVSLDDVELRPDTGAGPEQHAEAADLAGAVARGMREALTAYQRKIAVALLVDQVPIDVLAERLGTTRGALYKALHEIRGRLRTHLTATGHLTPPITTADTR
jgi:RNA polymerase sigma-70 factor (ECF subfamily)